jgi:uncharacterized protein
VIIMTQTNGNVNKMANPGALGLMGFGMTTILLNLHNAGFFALGSMILAVGFFYGGLAQVMAGIMEWKAGNTFGMVAFLSYGMFWISLVALLVIPKMGIGATTEPEAMAAYLFLWGIFSLAMFVGTLRTNGVMMFVFASLTLLFVLLGLGDALGNSDITRIAGWEGIVCGASAIYLAVAEILNEVYGKVVLPIFSAAKLKTSIGETKSIEKYE